MQGQRHMSRIFLYKIEHVLFHIVSNDWCPGVVLELQLGFFKGKSAPPLRNMHMSKRATNDPEFDTEQAYIHTVSPQEFFICPTTVSSADKIRLFFVFSCGQLPICALREGMPLLYDSQ